MAKENILQSFQLKAGEEIVMQEDFSEQLGYNGPIFFFFFLILGIYLFGLDSDLNIFIRYSVLISFIILGAFLWIFVYQNYRYILLITNERAIRLPPKNLIPFKLKQEEILLKNIDFITTENEEIIIVEKESNGEPHYIGNETENIRNIKGVKIMIYYLSKENRLHFKKKILELLIDLTKAKKHPNLPEVYISTKIFKN